MMKQVIILYLSIFCVNLSFAQSERKYIREGNTNYTKDKYSNASVAYNKALSADSNSFVAKFNTGAASYKQKDYKDALKKYETLANQNVSKEEKAKVYHNLGNVHLQNKDYGKSVQAYKQALKNNPTDEDTRYNLAYAQKMLQSQQNQQNKGQDNKEKDKDKDKKDQQNKDQKDQDQKKDKDKDKNQKDKDQKDKQNENQQNKEEQNKGINKQDAERMLNALNEDEKRVQDKVKKEMMKPVIINIEKDW